MGVRWCRDSAPHAHPLTLITQPPARGCPLIHWGVRRRCLYTLFNYFYFFLSQPVQPVNYLVNYPIRSLDSPP